MGLIKAAMGSVGGVLGDQRKEYFVCESLDADTLVAKGVKKTSERSSNTSGEDNIITNGSKITVANGQCMIIVEKGKVVEVCAEPGEYTYDQSSEPTVFGGDLGSDLVDVLHNIGKRFTFGGVAPNDQRIYYVNTKEIMGNKYGTPQPVPFKVFVQGTQVMVRIRCFGEYSYRIVNPILFYTNVCGNVEGAYARSEIDGQLKTELMTALQPALSKVAEKGIGYSDLPGHTMEIADALNDVLSKKWAQLRGIQVISFGVSSVAALPEDEKRIQDVQFSMAYSNPAAAAGRMVSATADAMQDAAKNQGGAMTGFMGMGMAQQAGGVDAGQLFGMAQRQAAQPQAQQASAGGWTCSCGAQNTGRFCQNCGKPQPAPAGWTCSCGMANTGNFCQNCGKPRPAADWTCSCGTTNKGKFCQNCGKPRP